MIKVVSVVRDREMYARCVADNACFEGCGLVPLYNDTENLPITVRYNSFIDSLEEPCWVMFCHEDWSPSVPVREKLETLSPDFLYGPIGVFVEEHDKVDVIVQYGFVSQSSKNGRHCARLRGKEFEHRVDTFDCQCLIVHSSLLGKYGLRFDENLTFDMYVEDFCVNAYEKYGIESRTIYLPCRHCSTGTIGPRFHNSLAYVKDKYRDSRKRYSTTVGHLNTFGRNQDKAVFKWKRKLISKLMYRLLNEQ